MNRRRDLVLLAVGLAALGVMLRVFGTEALIATLAHVRPVRLGAYLLLAGVVVLGHSLRWRLVIRSLGADPPIGLLVRARLAGEAVGVFVPSGKVAGEPVRFALVRGHCGDGPLAAAGVAIDRILEALGNLACVLVYGAVFAQAHSAELHQAGAWPVVGMAVVFLAGIVALLIAARRGVRPLAPLYGAWVQKHFPACVRWAHAVERTEANLLRFFSQHPGAFIQGVLASLGVEALVVLEFYVLFSAFGIRLDLPTLLMCLVMSGLVRAVPTPGGIGALEAGQVALLEMTSGRAELGFIVGVVMRLHEVLMMAVGFLALALQGFFPRRFARLAESAEGSEQ